jgi:phosphohistidine phosphatase SixA
MEQPMQTRIIVCRHPEKEGDRITAHGAQQAFAAAVNLANRGFEIERFIYSGARRTWQAVQIMATALDVEAGAERWEGFHFQGVLDTLGVQNTVVLGEISEIREHGGTLAAALETSTTYARLCREQLTEALEALASDMEQSHQRTALVLSHSPYLECAALEPAEMPYALGESDAVIYTLETTRTPFIVSSTLIKAPIPGATH